MKNKRRCEVVEEMFMRMIHENKVNMRSRMNLLHAKLKKMLSRINVYENVMYMRMLRRCEVKEMFMGV
jgi:hypothetical protein